MNHLRAKDWAALKPPLLRFLDACHADFANETGGNVADYIPELGKADPDHFGISLATLDGHVYEVGDTRIPFTIQSMSKPFVFALALDTLGAARVESAGVETALDGLVPAPDRRDVVTHGGLVQLEAELAVGRCGPPQCDDGHGSVRSVVLPR